MLSDTLTSYYVDPMQYYSVKDACKMLNVSNSYLRNLIARLGIKTIKQPYDKKRPSLFYFAIPNNKPALTSYRTVISLEQINIIRNSIGSP